MPFVIPIRPGQIPADVGPPMIGPAEGDLTELPYASLAAQVSVRWVPVHDFREYGEGTKEPVWNGEVMRAYRARFTCGWPFLETDIADALAAALFYDGPIWFAPYSTDLGAASPQAFLVNVIGDIPDEDDLRTGRRPITVEFETVGVFTVEDGVPVRGNVVIEPPGPAIDIPEAPANLAFVADEPNAELDWTWDAVAEAGGYFFRWGTVEGGPYPNLADVGLATAYSTPAVEGETIYAVVSTYAEIEV